MSTQELAHRFFHEPDKRGEYARVNTSFLYYSTMGGVLVWKYFSYSTCIGEIRRNKDGEFCLLVSDETYSKCTAKHLSELVRACPFPRNRILYVPRVGNGFFYGDYYYIKGTYDFTRALQKVACMTEKDLRKQENRRFVKRTICLYDGYQFEFKDTTGDEKKLRKSAKVAKVIAITKEKDDALDARRAHVATPEELAKRAKQKAKKEERIQRKIAECMGEGISLEKLEAVFGGRSYYRRGMQYAYDNIKDEALREAMIEYRKMLGNKCDSKGRGLSYVWLDSNGDACTSQRCRVSRHDVLRLLSMWKNKQNIIGEKAGMYTVVENTPESVKIGCHVIPTWNIELLIKAFASENIHI